eukprot:11561702-Heterocapsa_arctica.AAC.1
MGLALGQIRRTAGKMGLVLKLMPRVSDTNIGTWQQHPGEMEEITGKEEAIRRTGKKELQ